MMAHSENSNGRRNGRSAISSRERAAAGSPEVREHLRKVDVALKELREAIGEKESSAVPAEDKAGSK